MVGLLHMKADRFVDFEGSVITAEMGEATAICTVLRGECEDFGSDLGLLLCLVHGAFSRGKPLASDALMVRDEKVREQVSDGLRGAVLFDGVPQQAGGSATACCRYSAATD